MHEQSFISFVGGQGAKRLLDMLYKLAFNAKSNKIALDRHYAKTFLQIVARVDKFKNKVDRAFLTRCSGCGGFGNLKELEFY
ncbi:hypothetical protein HSHS1_13340 [Helicobacter suis HS1]|nr:hypothetical protein HSHS1_13340 [Helicobacter suis HS1]